MNDQLYQRFKAVDTSKLDAESKRLTEFYLQKFEIAGADLTTAQKEEVKKVNSELATLSTQFSNKLLDARKTVVF